MATLTTFSTDPLVRKVVLHVYAKNVKADNGSAATARKKFVRTVEQISVGYGLNLPSNLLKSKVKEMDLEIAKQEWIDEDKGYNSETVRNQIMSRYPQSMPASSAAAAAASGYGARDSSTLSADAQHVGRQLQLIQGELGSIASSLRVLTDRVITGGRSSVKKALEKLGNSSADPDESDDDAVVLKSKQSRSKRATDFAAAASAAAAAGPAAAASKPPTKRARAAAAASSGSDSDSSDSDGEKMDESSDGEKGMASELAKAITSSVAEGEKAIAKAAAASAKKDKKKTLGPQTKKGKHAQ